MEAVLDSVRRIVNKWANTATPITENVSAGDTTLTVKNTHRFREGDTIIIRSGNVYELSDLVIEDIPDETHIVVETPVLNNWDVSSNPLVQKTIYHQIVQGIYIGDPDVIPRFPAITVNGGNRSSEWLTLESTTERYEIEIKVMVQASTHEDGYRFLLNLTDTIQKGLKRNLLPLIDNYTVIPLAQSASRCQVELVVDPSDWAKFEKNRRVLIEDTYFVQENWVTQMVNDGQRIRVANPLCQDFDMNDTHLILPQRFIYNSWPYDIDFGNIHKGELLKASVIRWFAEEEEMQWLRGHDTGLT